MSSKASTDAKAKLESLGRDAAESEVRPEGVADAVWGESTRGKETGQKSTFSEEEKGNGNKVAEQEKVDMSPVEIASHLSIWSGLYHMLWSGEIQHFRQGVLSDGQATVLCVACLFIPLLPVLSMGIAFVCVRRIFAEGFEAHTGSIVFVQFVRTTLLQMSSTDDGKAFMHLLNLEESAVAIFLYFIDLYIGCTFTYSWLCIGKNWNAYHGPKMAIFLVIFAILHNPFYGVRHVFG